jgi:hypothetical protein
MAGGAALRSMQIPRQTVPSGGGRWNVAKPVVPGYCEWLVSERKVDSTW